MNPKLVANLVWNLASLVALVAVVRVLVFPSIRAEFRFRIFDVRRRLFKLMASGEIDRRAPAYNLLRQYLNGMLATAEGMTGLTFVLMGILVRARKLEAPRLDQHPAVLRLPPPIREKMVGLVHESSYAVALYLSLLLPCSPSLWAAFAFLLARAFLRKTMRFVLKSSPMVRGFEGVAKHRGEERQAA